MVGVCVCDIVCMAICMCVHSSTHLNNFLIEFSVVLKRFWHNLFHSTLITIATREFVTTLVCSLIAT